MKQLPHRKTIVARLSSAVFWLLIWTLASYAAGSPLLLPSPFRVFTRFAQLAVTADFWLTSLFSLLRVLLGFLLGITSGTAAAFLSSKFRIVDNLLSPVLKAAKATPVASFIIVTLVWIGKESVPVFISFLIVLPVVWENMSAGFTAVHTDLREVATIFQFSPLKKSCLLLLPSAMPYLLSACRTGIGMAWKAGVAAEVLCTPNHSIGKMLFESKLYLETADLFAWTLAVILLSILLEFAVIRLLSLAGKKYSTISSAQTSDEKGDNFLVR